ncbi:MAG: MFS transporter [Chlamydiota bacterium]
MKVFSFLRPAPHTSPIENPQEVETTYRYWRLRTFYAMYFGYVFYYFTRKSFTFIMPALHREGFDLVSLGLIGSSLSIMYGCSKFFSGILGDQSNPRYFMAMGLILTGVCNILFSLSSSLILFAIFWGINGCFQGWGWPGCAKLLTHWYAQNERGFWWSLWNTSHNLGGALIPLLIGLFAEHFGWRFCMVIPGIFCILGGFFLINRLRDTPESLGLPPIEVYKNGEQKQKAKQEELPVNTILSQFILKNPYIWALALSNFFVYVIRTAVNDWSFLYYYEQSANNPYAMASACCCSFEVGGLFGSLFAGFLSDRLFLGKRNPVNIVYLIGMLLMCYCMKTGAVAASFFPNMVVMFFTGFFIFGPQMLIGMAAAELSHKKAAATASGFTGCLGYLGAAFAGLPLGHVVTHWGWDGYFTLLACCAFLAMVILLPLWDLKENPRQEAIDALV